MRIKPHKFKAQFQFMDGIRFSSKKEAGRYYDLKKLQEKGDVVFFLRQAPFHLEANVKYVCDFVVFWKEGDITFEDVKGYKTPIYIMKKKMVESAYPIKITEI